MTSGITSWPCAIIGLPETLRSAMCIAARPSVGLTVSPANRAPRPRLEPGRLGERRTAGASSRRRRSASNSRRSGRRSRRGSSRTARGSAANIACVVSCPSSPRGAPSGPRAAWRCRALISDLLCLDRRRKPARARCSARPWRRPGARAVLRALAPDFFARSAQALGLERRLVAQFLRPRARRHHPASAWGRGSATPRNATIAAAMHSRAARRRHRGASCRGRGWVRASRCPCRFAYGGLSPGIWRECASNQEDASAHQTRATGWPASAKALLRSRCGLCSS